MRTAPRRRFSRAERSAPPLRAETVPQVRESLRVHVRACGEQIEPTARSITACTKAAWSDSGSSASFRFLHHGTAAPWVIDQQQRDSAGLGVEGRLGEKFRAVTRSPVAEDRPADGPLPWATTR